ncbi:MAG: hypothetical protein ABL949_01660 [Fimbriimonadaceae bacterium]
MKTAPPAITPTDIELLRSSFLRIIPAYEVLCGRLSDRMSIGTEGRLRLERLFQVLARAIDAADHEGEWDNLAQEATGWADIYCTRRDLRAALQAEFSLSMSRSESRAWRTFLTQLLAT